MSDKPIQAEVVRADQIRPGDRIVFEGDIRAVEKFEEGENTVCVEFDGDEYTEFLAAWCLVARILPEPTLRAEDLPVEVREFWRVHYERFAIINGKEDWQRGITVARDTEEQARKSFEGRYPVNRGHIRSPIIEHVRETIISREEIKP